MKAFDAKNGKELWAFQTGSGVVSVPMMEDGGKQYIGIASGYGGAVPLWGGDMADQTKLVSQGGSFWVFEVPPIRRPRSSRPPKDVGPGFQPRRPPPTPSPSAFRCRLPSAARYSCPG